MLGWATEFLRDAISDQVLRDPIWAAIALVGQVVFGGRFIVQWIASERAKQSCIPPIFWWMSVVGSTIMFAYSVHLENPILMIGFSINTLIYMRNLHLLRGASARTSEQT